MKTWIKVFALLSVVILLPYGCYKVVFRNHYLRFAPCGMEVSGIDYSATEAWGIGLPGGNETGVIAYSLPASTIHAVETQGIEYLRQLPCGPVYNGDLAGRYDEWHQTPMPGDKKWGVPPRLKSYLNHRGFGIPISAPVEQSINDAVSSSGNFYAYGRTGLFMIAPKARKAFFMYAG